MQPVNKPRSTEECISIGSRIVCLIDLVNDNDNDNGSDNVIDHKRQRTTAFWSCSDCCRRALDRDTSSACCCTPCLSSFS